jgi:hypothetical protein
MAEQEELTEAGTGSAPKAFLVPASDPEARANLKKTIYGKVPLTQIGSLPDDVNELAEAASADDGFNAWGCRDNRVGTWGKLSDGDLCLFYQSGMFVAVGRVAGKVKSSALGKNLWGDAVWEYCYFLTDVQEVAIPSSAGLRVLGYEKDFAPRGFAVVNRQDGSNEPFQVTSEVVSGLEAATASTKPALKKAVAVISATTDPEDGDDAQGDTQMFETVNDLESAGVDLSDEALKEQLAKAGSLTPEQETALVKRFRRCQKLARKVKELYDGKCQVCGFTFQKQGSGKPYAEAAHLVALGDGGSDSLQNLLCLCPNHHKMLDHGPLDIRWNETAGRLEANVDPESKVLTSGYAPVLNLHISNA